MSCVCGVYTWSSCKGAFFLSGESAPRGKGTSFAAALIALEKAFFKRENLDFDLFFGALQYARSEERGVDYARDYDIP